MNVNKKCALVLVAGCTKQPKYGKFGATKVEFCARQPEKEEVYDLPKDKKCSTR